MVMSVFVLEPDVDVKFDRALYSRFFINNGINKLTFFSGQDGFTLKNNPLCDFLVIAYQIQKNSDARTAAIKSLSEMYLAAKRPIIQVPSKEIATIGERFKTMTFGGSLELLKSKDAKISHRAKAIFVIARFFSEKPFARSEFKQRLQQLVKDFPENQIGTLVQDFANKGFIKLKERGVYSFLGLDDKMYAKLETLGFDLHPDMKLKKPQANNKPLQKEETVTRTAKATDFDEMVRLEFAHLKEELVKQMQEQLQKALTAQKLNTKLLRLSPKDLERADAMLDLLASN